MSRLTALLPLVSAAGLLAACDGAGGPTAVWPSAARPAFSTQTMVPIKVTTETAAVPDGVTVDCKLANGAVVLAVPAHYTAGGNISHLGRLDAQASTGEFTACRILMSGGIFGEADVAQTFVGANGDAIFVSGVLSMPLGAGDATGTWQITGGTGRFSGASGSYTTAETTDPVRQISLGTGSGTITPPGVLLH